MKILQINKFLWVSGGVERYMFDVAKLLESNGHEIVYFSMADEARNPPLPESKYFVRPIDYGQMGLRTAVGRSGRIVSRTVYSFEARRKMRALIRDLKPDIAHVHLIDHHISPSILDALRAENVPVVQTIHEYKLVCPNYKLYIPRKGEVCERCLHGGYYNCALQRCMKDSLAASLLVTGAMYLHRAMNIYPKNVDAFLCSTRFLQDKLAEGGVPREQLRHVPLYIDLESYDPADACEDYIVYAGRLAQEKGLMTLIDAVSKAPGVTLRIAGDGEAREQLENHARRVAPERVEFMGRLDRPELNRLIARSRFLVLPSELYETCGLAVWEAHALKRPAIGATIGGIPESIEDGATGLMFESGNADELAGKISDMFEKRDASREMGVEGRARLEKVCAQHYEALMGVYEEALAKH